MRAGSKEKVIDKATEIFHAQGYRAASLDVILRESRVSKSNFYYHFRSKEDLSLQILERRIESYEDNYLLPTLLNDSLTPTERLEGYLTRVTAYHDELNCEKGCPFGNLALEMSDTSEVFRRRLSEFFKEWERAVTVCIEEGIKTGEFRSDLDAAAMALMVLSFIEGAIMLVKTHRSLEPLETVASALLMILKPV